MDTGIELLLVNILPLNTKLEIVLFMEEFDVGVKSEPLTLYPGFGFLRPPKHQLYALIYLGTHTNPCA